MFYEDRQKINAPPSTLYSFSKYILSGRFRGIVLCHEGGALETLNNNLNE